MSKRKTPDLSRKSAKREPYKMILIVCEGKETEKNYFENLRAYEKLSSVNIQVLSGSGSAPINVVKTAIDIKNSPSNNLPFDEVYCVIDRDTHSTFNDAIKLAKENNIKIIVSYPCFEYWFLCHFIYCRSPFIKSGNRSAGDNCEQLLNRKWQEAFKERYEKSKSGTYTSLLSRLDRAIENANRSLADAEKDNEYNPSTQVHLLVDELRKIKG